MKSKLRYLAAGILLLLVVAVPSAWAITVTVDGQPLPAAPPAFERNGRVLLPMRVVFESLGATVQWRPATRSALALRGARTIEVTIGSPMAYVDRQPVSLDVAPVLVRGIFYMPVRVPAQALGAKVDWDRARQLVTITRPRTITAQAPPTLPYRARAPQACVSALPAAPVGGVVNGVVAGLSANQIAVRIGSCIENFVVTPGTQIALLGQPAQLCQLAPGEQVVMAFDPRRFALQVQAMRACAVCQLPCSCG